MTSLYLIRHGQATGNIEQRFQGRAETDLTEEGRRQAALLAVRFASVPLHAVYSSPLARARQTAALLAEAKELDVVVEPRLNEMNFGDMENCFYDEVAEMYPREIDLFFNYPHQFSGVGDGAESMQALQERMVGAMSHIARTHPRENVAAFSHGCAIRALLCHCMGYPLSRLYDVEASNNTGVSHITIHESGSIMVHRVGDDTHLGPDSRWKLQQAVRR